tara:strand:- start:604 stop:1188 length:585 start_codon:yes stop_codon:yes gene_type:complete
MILKNKRIPEFIMFVGPMFSGKTSRLLATIDRFQYQNKRVAVFKPQMDERYSKTEIVTHNGKKIDAQLVKDGFGIFEKISEIGDDIDVIAVDEAFMIDNISDALHYFFRKGKTIVVSSLQLSASGKVFEEVRDMMPWATKIEVCSAVCPVSGLDAYYTHKKFNSLNEITVGGSELYEPRSWFYHSYMNTIIGEE